MGFVLDYIPAFITLQFEDPLHTYQTVPPRQINQSLGLVLPD
jgi:hypothetical protein